MNRRCLAKFNDTADPSLVLDCSLVDVELDFSGELDLYMDDVGGFGGWREGIAVGG